MGNFLSLGPEIHSPEQGKVIVRCGSIGAEGTKNPGLPEFDYRCDPRTQFEVGIRIVKDAGPGLAEQIDLCVRQVNPMSRKKASMQSAQIVKSLSWSLSVPLKGIPHFLLGLGNMHMDGDIEAL